ncbi:MAG: FHA domain-containing protein [Anaerolineales bacterium]
MSSETICLGLPLVAILVAGWVALVSYADYVVAQFDRYAGHRGQSLTTMGRLFGLPWQTSTQLVVSALLFGLGALLLALLHWVVLLLAGIVIMGGFAAMLLADAQRLEMIVAQIPPSKPELPVLRPSLLPVSSVLVGRHGEYQGVEIECVPNMRIGRGVTNNLNLREKSVSRKHARLCYSQGAWFIQDKDSATGVYINGQRERARRLNHGDIIMIGSSEFEFREG